MSEERNLRKRAKGRKEIKVVAWARGHSAQRKKKRKEKQNREKEKEKKQKRVMYFCVLFFLFLLLVISYIHSLGQNKTKRRKKSEEKPKKKKREKGKKRKGEKEEKKRKQEKESVIPSQPLERNFGAPKVLHTIICAFGWLIMKAFQEKFETRKAHHVEATISCFLIHLLVKEKGRLLLANFLLPLLSIFGGFSDNFDL